MARDAGSGTGEGDHYQMSSSPQGLSAENDERKRVPLLFRIKVPAWLALVGILVTVLVAFFLTGPARSIARDFDRNFDGVQQVEIRYCLSNAQAVEAGRERSRVGLENRLRELGVKDPKIEFVSPCPLPNTSPDLAGPGASSNSAGT